MPMVGLRGAFRPVSLPLTLFQAFLQLFEYVFALLVKFERVLVKFAEFLIGMKHGAILSSLNRFFECITLSSQVGDPRFERAGRRRLDILDALPGRTHRLCIIIGLLLVTALRRSRPILIKLLEKLFHMLFFEEYHS